jgi:ABC-type sugar transport system permease subunit
MRYFNNLRFRELTLVWLFLLPALAIFIAYRVIPIIWVGILSFQKWSLFGEPSWNGLTNFRELLQDDVFWQSLSNTIIFLIGSAAAIPVAIGFALLVNAPIRFAGMYRSIIFLSYPLMTVAIGVVWKWMYDEKLGLINYILVKIGVLDHPTAFLQSFNWALPAVIFAWTWHIVGLFMVIIISGLQTIPADLYDAAALDGAGRIRSFFSVTLPLIKSTLFLCFVLAVLNSYLSFDLVYVLTNGGPGHATELLVTYIYKNAFELNRLDYGSALTIVMFALLLGITLIANRIAGGDAGGGAIYD